MFEDADAILRGTKGTLVERPLPHLVEAIAATRRTCGLELKRAGLEKTLIFSAGVPVGCISNQVHETIGRFLVERELISGQQYMQVLNESARRQVSFETVLLEKALLDPTKLEKLQQANLGQKLLDCFRLGDARFRIVGDVDVPEQPQHINSAQLLFTAICSVMSADQICAQFPVDAHRRFARTRRAPVRVEDLKLAPADAALLEAVGERLTVDELVARTGLDLEGLQRRLYAFALLGMIDEADRVPLTAPEPPEPEPDPTWRPEPVPAPKLVVASRGSRWPWIGLVFGLLAGAAAAWIVLAPAEAPPAPVAVQPPRKQRTPPPEATRDVEALAAAPEGARAQPDQPRGLQLSASRIDFPVPEPTGKGWRQKMFARVGELLRDGDAEKAEALLGKLVKPELTAPVAYGLALADYELGKDEEALVHAKRALELDETYATAHLLAGFLEQQAGRGAEARAHYAAWLEKDGDDPAAADVRALIEQLGG